LRTWKHGISLDSPGGFRYNKGILGVEVMLDPIDHNFIVARTLAASIPSAARPRLAGAVREPQVIPVDVRIRLVCDELLVPTKAVASSTPVSKPRPIGTLLDCYM
jgi:hypothetical protein